MDDAIKKKEEVHIVKKLEDTFNAATYRQGCGLSLVILAVVSY